MRLELTVHELTRVGLAGVDPLVETTASLRLLHNRGGAVPFAWWKRWVRHRLPESTRALAWLCRPGGALPTCLLPFPGRPDLESALAAVRETSPERLHEDVLRAAGGRGIPHWAASLADGNTAALATALREYFEAALNPHWPTVHAQVEADREHRTQILLTGGVYALLTSLRPLVTWHSPALPAERADDDVRLGGARLVLMPAFFSVAPEIITACDGQPARLVYPAERTAAPSRTSPGDQRKALADLLGPTRAAALRTMAAGCSTSELATLLGVTPSAVRNTVLHSLTPLGNALLAT
jgi:hypothetical protein